MAMLLFNVGDNRYAIDAQHVVRIIPQVLLKKMPYTILYMAGLLNMAGHPIPIVDFSQLIENRHTQFFLNSRIILVKDPQASERCVGILAENVNDVVDLHPEQFNQSELYIQHYPYLDKNYSDESGIIQCLNVEAFFRFLSSEIFNCTWQEHETL